MMVEVRPLTQNDISELTPLAKRIFSEHYKGMISDEQIAYMLTLGFDAENYTALLDYPQSRCHVAWFDNRIIGYVALKPLEETSQIFVRRLYVDEQYRGKGAGRALLDSLNAKNIILRVNRDNHDSIAFYKRYGFCIKGENKRHIGNGFVMDDYIMERKIEPVLSG